MAHVAEQHRWVSLEVPAYGGPVRYDLGDIHDLSRRRTKNGVTLRVIAEAQALTKGVIAALDGIAEKIVHQAANTAARRVIEGYWETNVPVMDFLYARGQQLRPVHPSNDLNVAETWELLLRAAGARSGPPYIIQLERAGTALPLDQVWAEFARTIDAAMEYPTADSDAGAGAADPTEARRLTLLALNWPTSAEASRRGGSTSRNAAQWAKDKRDAGQLLGVWSTSERTYRHPDFQFNPDGSLRPEVRELLAALAANSAWTAKSDANGWRRTYWLYQPFRSLSRRSMAFDPDAPSSLKDSPDGAAAMLDMLLGDDPPEDRVARTPADVFAENPQAIIAFARTAAVGDQPHTDVGLVAHGD